MNKLNVIFDKSLLNTIETKRLRDTIKSLYGDIITGVWAVYEGKRKQGYSPCRVIIKTREEIEDPSFCRHLKNDVFDAFPYIAGYVITDNDLSSLRAEIAFDDFFDSEASAMTVYTLYERSDK